MHLSTWDNRLEKNLFFIFDKRHEMNVLVHPNHQESLTRILLSIWMFQYIQEVPFFDSDEYILKSYLPLNLQFSILLLIPVKVLHNDKYIVYDMQRTSMTHLFSTKIPDSRPEPNMDRSKLHSPRAMIRNRPGNQAPKFLRVIELFQVTELVDDDVIGKVNRETRDAIVEVEIPLLGATSPSRSLIPDRDSVVDETVVLIKNLQAAMHKPPRVFSLSVIVHVVFHSQRVP